MECPACSGTGTSESDVARDGVPEYTIQMCKDCGTEYALPRVAASGESYAQMGEFYGWRWEFDECLALTRESIPHGRVLEVGCGEGLLLNKLRSEGLEVTGADINAKSVERARERGLDVIEGGLAELATRFPRGSFDAAVLFHVLEHVPNPARFLVELAEFLAPGGWLFVSVPNPHRATALLIKEPWDDPPHHLTRFSKNGFRRVFESSGAEVVSISTQPLDISTYRLASLRADAMAFPRAACPVRVPKAVRYLKKLAPFILSLPSAIMACRRGGGTAMLAVARKAL